MAQLKAGTRLKSSVCATEVMVIAAPANEVAVTCGGAAMVGMKDDPISGATLEAGGEPPKMGKRYVNEEGSLELLCTKPGEGSLAVGGTAMAIKGAKPLPASD